jgi:hypothetical protein
MTLLFAHRTLALVDVVEFAKRTTLLYIRAKAINIVLVFIATDESVVAF